MVEGARLTARWCGRQAFAACLEAQLAAREALVTGEGPPTLLLVEHPPTLTLGRRGRREDVLWPDKLLAERELVVVDSPRGGEVTLHAPGQLVAYPVVVVGRKIRAHMERMAHVTVGLFEALGVFGTAFRRDRPGVWLGPRKLASIGIHISRGVAVQGISVNLDVDPALFTALVSCGMGDTKMASVSNVGGRSVSVEGAARAWAVRFARAAGVALQWDGEPPRPDPVLS